MLNNHMEVYRQIVQKTINNSSIDYFGNLVDENRKQLNPHSIWESIYKNNEISGNAQALSIVKINLYLYIINPQLRRQYIQNKFKLLRNMYTNPFHNFEIKSQFLTIFCKCQRTYFALTRFVRICKHKITTIYNSTDIGLNPIESTQTNIIKIYQNGKIYLFTRSDILNIMNAALSHSPNFYSEPLHIKNPYNNMVFTKSDLYNFYFFIRTGLFIISDLIQNYFLAHFNLRDFQKKNEYIIRDYYIKSYVNTTPINELLTDIKYMLKTINLTKTLNIHLEFPNETLVRIMKPYLLLYYQSVYSVDSYKRDASYSELILRMAKFVNYNPLFGRKIMIFQKQIKIQNNVNTSLDNLPANPNPFSLYTKKTTFNEKYLPFNNKDNSFMTSQKNAPEPAPDSESDLESEYNSD